MLTLVYSILSTRDALKIKTFRNNVKIKEYFTEEEIELMLSINSNVRKTWSDRSECEDLILVKLYEKEGPWYNKFFYDWASEIIKKDPKSRDEVEKIVHEYCKKPPLEGKGGIFESYVKARLYYEKIKPLRDNEREKQRKTKKFKYKIEEGAFEEIFK